MATLSEYMERHDLSDQQMADRLGCSRTRVSKIRRRGERPSVKLAIAIERATDGDVLAMAMLAAGIDDEASRAA